MKVYLTDLNEFAEIDFDSKTLLLMNNDIYHKKITVRLNDLSSIRRIDMNSDLYWHYLDILEKFRDLSETYKHLLKIYAISLDEVFKRVDKYLYKTYADRFVIKRRNHVNKLGKIYTKAKLVVSTVEQNYGDHELISESIGKLVSYGNEIKELQEKYMENRF